MASAAEFPMPDADEIHVWSISLADTGQVSPSLTRLLSAEEAARAARFIFERDRARFTVAHAALRDILATYTREDAATLRFLAAEKGKPYLVDHPDLRFNLSHSGSWALVAIANGRDVGVDIEAIRGERPTVDIAERFFAPAEVRELLETPEDLRTQAFFACWSRKEAYIKARGEGLHISLDSFEVSLGDTAILRKAEDRDRWTLCSLEAPEGYKAALVAEGSGWRVKRFVWSGHPEI
jgi:4'-phosphopantetheinyl transferase